MKKIKPRIKDKWFQHFGESDPPIPIDTRVEVMFRDGTFGISNMGDWDQNWQWANSLWGLKSDGAIIGYRIL